MELSWFERLAMRSTFRNLVMKYSDAPRLFGKNTFENQVVLELGCGSGVGTKEILKRYPKRLVATDYDSKMIKNAERRLRNILNKSLIDLEQADATNLRFDSETFDSIVAFAILHHISDYKKAIKEINRVLKSGGKFYAEEVTQDIHFFPVNKLMVPEVLFSEKQVISDLEASGFSVQLKSKYLNSYLFLECTKVA